MSILPQHKKSAEEIAKLRESLGVHGEVTPVEESPAPQPTAEVHPPKQVHSLKRAEKIPGLPEENHEPHLTLAEPVQASAEPVEPVVHIPKIVRSLRKSEQGPLPEIHQPPLDSKLPIHRHSEEEIQRIRRQETLTMQANAGHLLSKRAHLALVIPGYLFAVAGAVSFYFYDFDKAVTAACVGLALLIAAFIFIKKPLSVHHAAFIAVASLFVIVFGALHYFPHLQHGT
jgi:hypothetical protein